ncbi:MAG: 6-carboxytetrahydropterin synthase QueD [Deltaproteobacteria bacterium]|nr:6-carboxytetrahydropterin synthase QueD [Deltaproteobacteria bacterium]
MYELRVTSQFSAAHLLRDHKGECENLHGHNWKIEAYVAGRELGKDGLMIDFKIIKEKVEKALKELDHKYLNELEPFKKQNPSSENIARHIFTLLSREMNEGDIRVSKVTVWESDTASASYMES